MNLYGIENRNTIGKAIMVADSRTTGDWLYNGRYGKGFVRVVPSYYKGKPSTKFMTIQYWVEK